jgi:FtsH-binding integral membrane protein
MSPSTLYRLSGISLIVGGLLGTVAVALHPSNMIDPANIPVHFALYWAVMLTALGLPALYARQAERAGVPGLIGTVLVFFGVVFVDPIHSVLEFTVVPLLGADPATRPLLDGPPPGLMGPLLLAVPVLLVGLLVMAIASFRAGVFPRWPAALAFATVVMVVVGFALSGPQPNDSPVSEIGPALLYLTFAAYGYVLAMHVGRTPSTIADPPLAERVLAR